MNDKQYLSSKYPDLLSKDADPDLLRLVGNLDRVATTGEPPQRVATAIEAMILERSAQVAARGMNAWQPAAVSSTPKKRLKWQRQSVGPLNYRRLWLPVTGVGLAVVLLVVMFSAGTGVFGVANEEHKLLKPIVGVEHLEAAGMGKQVNLSQTINGYTVSVGWVYADGNDVLVRYDVSPESTDSGLRVDIGPLIELTDDQGTHFPSNTGGIQTFNREGSSATYAIFDTSRMATAPTSLNLHLKVDLEGRMRPSDIRKLITPGAKLPKMARESLSGPFIFNFTVPFIPARIAHVDQTVKADGAAITLEELRIAPSEARAIVHIAPPSDHISLEWRPELILKVGNWLPGMDPQGKAYPHGSVGGGGQGGPVKDGSWAQSWFSVPYDSQEVWTVKVTKLTGYAPELDPKVVLNGPWVFNVTVPPSGQK